MSAFLGFQPPQENWSRLPHQLIDFLPEISSVAELKVVLYILRHTWGYGDTEKRISVDEFCNGRLRADGSRIDGGCGISPNSVRSGLDAAVAHGLITVAVDDSDLARIKKYYALAVAVDGVQDLRSGVQKLNPDAQKLNPGGAKVEHRTEKETIERNSLSLAPAAPEFSDPRIISEDPPQGPKNRGLELPIDLRQLQGNHYPPGQGKNGYQVYREFFDYIPGRSVIQEMNRVVGADPASLQRWRDVLFAYDLSGKASNWVKVQLEWFRDGIPAAWDPNQKGNSSNAQPATNSRNGNTNGAKPRPALGPSVLDLPESEQQRIAALLAGRRPAAVAAD